MPHGIYLPELAEAFKAHVGEKWRPSNGMEGEVFIESWCCNCAAIDNACEILTATCAFTENDPEYPIQWQIGSDGQPKCTAFHAPGEARPTDRCDRTIDMFVEAS